MPVLSYEIQIQGHPWDLWGLSEMFTRMPSWQISMDAIRPQGRPERDYSPEGLSRWRERGFDIFSTMTMPRIPGVLEDMPGPVLWAATKSFVTAVEGWAKVLDEDFGPLKLHGISHRLAGGGGGSMNGDDGPLNKAHTQLARHERVVEFGSAALELARTDLRIRSVFQIMTLAHGWASLYLIFEQIREDVGGAANLSAIGNVSRTKVSNFTSAANNSRLLSQWPRHSYTPTVPAATRLMSLHDARQFIRDLVWDWISHKIQLNQPNP